MKIGIIIQARNGSHRFPGKIFAKLGGITVLDRVLTQVGRSGNADIKILAFPTKDADLFRDTIRLFKNYPIYPFAGDETDVLNRMIQAANAYGVDAVVRVCADSPFIQPWLINYGIDVFRKHEIDYLSTRCFAMGQNIEIVRTDVLEKIHPLANAEEREHVTLYLERHFKDYKCAVLDMKMVVDRPTDIGELEAVLQYYE